MIDVIERNVVRTFVALGQLRRIKPFSKNGQLTTRDVTGRFSPTGITLWREELIFVVDSAGRYGVASDVMWYILTSAGSGWASNRDLVDLTSVVLDPECCA
jgi:hypothetical protein